MKASSSNDSSNTGSDIRHLSESERLQLFIDAVTEYAIYMLDPEGFITSWNSGAEKIKGYSATEIIGQHYSRFFTPEDRASGLPARSLREASLKGRCESEGWRVRKDGSRFSAMTVLHPVRDRSGHLIGFAKITRDVTERVAAHQALAESERRFRRLVEGVTDYAIYMLDPSGVITNWNNGAQRMKGYTADEIVGQHFSRFYTKADRVAGLPLRVLEAAVSEGRFETEGWRVRKDGSRFWASVVLEAIRDERGELLGLAKITRDITERRIAQEALRESERQFRLLVEGVTDYALYMLDLNGVVISWNSGAQRIKGYTADEIIGHHFSRFYTERDKAAGVPARALYVAADQGRFETEGWRVRKDGSTFWANVIVDSIKDEDGKLIGFAKITQDITAKRNAQIALEEAQRQRDQAQKMEALGHLTGGVAHDFNNLLMIVGGYLPTIKKLVGEDPRGRRALDVIEAACARGQSLTRQLLSFSRRQTLNPVTISVSERIESFCRMIGSSVAPNAKLLVNISPDIWPVNVDVSELELALLNITINARDAMSKDGIITIMAENVELKQQDKPTQLEGEFVAITIADTGSGIPEEVLPKVFEPFFTTKESSKGSGLGLSQVYGFVQQSGGTVDIESRVGEGTRVTLYLPKADSLPEQSREDVVTRFDGGGAALLVDDNPDVLEVSSLLLQELGYKVHAAESVQAAIEALERENFALVVSDIVMPGGIDGKMLAQTIRSRKPHIPIVLVTGFSDAALSDEDGFVLIRKPYQLADLSRAIGNAVAKIPQPMPDNLITLGDRRPHRRL